MEIRKAMFAGSWYPAAKPECISAIQRFLEDPILRKPAPKSPVGGIVPHAGWYFSGNLACQVISSLKWGDPVETVVIFGMHLPQGERRYLMKAGAWETPFGEIEIDTVITGALSKQFSFTLETAHRFTPDNTIELQLPFIKYFHPEATLVPLGLPPEPDSLRIAESVAALAKTHGKNIRVIGSTDLTHYGPNYGFTPAGRGEKAISWVREVNDKRIVDAMVSLDPNRVMEEALARHNACCPGAAASAIAAAKALGAKEAMVLGYTTSHDKSPGDSLVGYAGIVF